MHFTNLVNVLGLALAAIMRGVIATAIPDNYVDPKGQGHGDVKDCWCLDPRPPSTLDGGDGDGDIAGAPTHDCCRESIGHRCPALGKPEQEEFKICCDRHALGAVCPAMTPE
ncbi:hypothetical protein V8F33_005866 [Rhypophila sp. PSN 637]